MASVLRLDRLGGRPIWEDEFLVLGRVWLRRDLLWLGFLLWVVLTLRTGLRPGSWKGAPRGDRASRGRDYLPGFSFRALFLLVALWIPALGALLVYPLGLLGLWKPPPAATALRVLWLAIGLLPAMVLTGLIGWLGLKGVLGGWDLSARKIALLILTHGAFALWLCGRQRLESASSAE